MPKCAMYLFAAKCVCSFFVFPFRGSVLQAVYVLHVKKG